MGPWHSSARAELVAMILASHYPHPVHIGLDNQAVVDKASLLVAMARDIQSAGAKWPAKPLKKTFLAAERWGLLGICLEDADGKRQPYHRDQQG